jgi:hypothetical protein
MLVRILEESDPFGADHHTVLDTLHAVQQLADDRAVPAVAAVMRRNKFFAWKKTRALKEAAVSGARLDWLSTRQGRPRRSGDQRRPDAQEGRAADAGSGMSREVEDLVRRLAAGTARAELYASAIAGGSDRAPLFTAR